MCKYANHKYGILHLGPRITQSWLPSSLPQTTSHQTHRPLLTFGLLLTLDGHFGDLLLKQPEAVETRWRAFQLQIIMANQPTPRNLPPAEIRPYDQGLLTLISP